ncbi:MAG: AEC family transporter, partial [bacterium]
MELSLSLATQIAALFIMIGVGFVLVKMKLCNVKDSRLLSQLTLYVSAPCAIVNSFQIELTADKVKGFLLAIGAAVVIHIIYLTLAEVFSRMFHFNVVEKASVIYSNCGNLILPLVQIVLGQEMVFYASGYMIVQTILLWTHCKTLISEEVNLDFKKIIFNINIIAILIGFILFVGRISLPVMVQSALTSMGNLMGPMSMFVIGMLLSQMNLKKVFGDKRAYLVTFLRLIVLPVVAAVLLYLFLIMTKRPRGAMKPFEDTLIAHRGLFGAGAPENTLAAFERAARRGY